MDFNLALIDVAAAWVVVAVPRMAQARLLAGRGLLSYGQEARLRIDPVQHTSVIGTLAVPAIASLLGIPVVAWGKGFDDATDPRRPRLALALIATTALTYAAQALLFAVLMMLLAKIYLAGAPVAARAGQLCLRLALLSLAAIPAMDAGVAWRFLGVPRQHWGWLAPVVTGALLTALWLSGLLRAIDNWVMLTFFYLTQAF